MIKKIFIKDYKNIYDSKVRKKYAIVSSVIGIVTNLLLGLMKFILGFFMKSVSIMSDACNNLTDTFSSILTMIGFKLSDKEPDIYHPFGYSRYEYITAYTISIFMIIMGLIFVKESIIKIIHPTLIEINYITYIILAISLVIKILQMLIYFDFSKMINSNALKTNAIETRNDIITTITILISMIIMSIYDINIDGYLGLIVSTYIVINSVISIKSIIDDLVGTIKLDNINYIGNKLLEYDIDTSDIFIYNYGANKCYIVADVIIPLDLSLVDTCKKMFEIEKHFKNKLNINLTIHIKAVKNK